MDLTENTAQFRAHAAARLTGDTAEAERIAASIGDEQRMSHLLFTLTLFSQFVLEELGYEPEPSDLAALTKRLHDRHYRPGGSFEALRAEAMIRAVTVEPILLTEIPHTEQAAYMWAVIDELADHTMTETELTERFDLAAEAGAELLGEALASPILKPRRCEAAQAEPSTSTSETRDTTNASGTTDAAEASESSSAFEPAESTVRTETTPAQEGTDA